MKKEYVSKCCGAKVYETETTSGLTGRVLGKINACDECHKPCEAIEKPMAEEGR